MINTKGNYTVKVIYDSDKSKYKYERSMILYNGMAEFRVEVIRLLTRNEVMAEIL